MIPIIVVVIGGLLFYKIVPPVLFIRQKCSLFINFRSLSKATNLLAFYSDNFRRSYGRLKILVTNESPLVL